MRVRLLLQLMMMMMMLMMMVTSPLTWFQGSRGHRQSLAASCMWAVVLAASIPFTDAAVSHAARNRQLYESLRENVEIDIMLPRPLPSDDNRPADADALLPKIVSHPIKMVDSFGRTYSCQAKARQGPTKDAGGATSETGKKFKPTQSSDPSTSSQPKLSEDELGSRLDFLASECAEKRLGWWHYRWCHLQSVEQYHLEKDGTMAAKTSLGVFDEMASDGAQREKSKEESIQKTRGSSTAKSKRKKYEHIFTKGDLCSETKTHRKTHVHFKCCPRAKTASSSSPSILSIEEPSTCNYRLTICTLHVCEDGEMPGSTSSGIDRGISKSGSISSLLQPLKGSCFQYVDGWWTYEFCYGSYFRQMHVEVKEGSSGNKIQQVQSAYELGKWGGETVAMEDESNHLVTLQSLSTEHVQTTAFAEEYSDGAVCEVTGKPRSTTVHFVCRGGTATRSKILSVKEDASCHYLLELHTPHLCVHPLFFESVEESLTIQCVDEKFSHAGA